MKNSKRANPTKRKRLNYLDHILIFFKYYIHTKRQNSKVIHREYETVAVIFTLSHFTYKIRRGSRLWVDVTSRRPHRTWFATDDRELLSLLFNCVRGSVQALDSRSIRLADTYDVSLCRHIGGIKIQNRYYANILYIIFIIPANIQKSIP